MTTPTLSAGPQWPAALAARPLLVAENHALEVREAWLAAEAEHRQMVEAGRAPKVDSARYEVQNGVAIIPVSGVLLNRYNFLGDGSPYTSYGALTREIRRASADTSIKAIVLGVNSPGGTADGILTPAAAIREARQTKPVTAYVGSMAASGGYWLAAQANEIVLQDDLSQVGSIGVYTMHMDISKLLESYGINVSVISSGRHKVDGHPFAPLPDAVRAEIQQEVDDLRLMFAREVAAGRSALTADLALATEARMFGALNPRTSERPALESKLADRIGPLSALIAGPTTRGRRASGSQERAAMTDISKEDHDKAVKAARDEGYAAGKTDGVAEGRAEGSKESSDRISAIMTSDEGKANAKLAEHFAYKTAMPVEEAKAALAAAGPANSSTTYEQRKAEAGAGGFVDEPTNQASASKDIWAKARQSGAGNK